MATKEPLKKRDPYKYNRNVYFGLKAGKWVSIITPFIVIFGVKFNEYIEVSEGETTKLTIGCILALIVAIVACYKDLKKEVGEKSPIAGAVGWGIAFALSFLFYTILYDLTLVLGVAFAGQCASAGCEIVANNKAEYLKAYKNAKVNAEATIQVQREMERDDGTRI